MGAHPAKHNPQPSRSPVHHGRTARGKGRKPKGNDASILLIESTGSMVQQQFGCAVWCLPTAHYLFDKPAPARRNRRGYKVGNYVAVSLGDEHPPVNQIVESLSFYKEVQRREAATADPFVKAVLKCDARGAINAGQQVRADPLVQRPVQLGT